MQKSPPPNRTKPQKSLHGVRSPAAARKQRVQALQQWLETNKACVDTLAKHSQEEEREFPVTPEAALVCVWDVRGRTTKTGWSELHLYRVGHEATPSVSLRKGGGKTAMFNVTMETYPESLRPTGALTAMATAIVVADPPLLTIAQRIERLGKVGRISKSNNKKTATKRKRE